MSERTIIRCDGCGEAAEAVQGRPHPAAGWLTFRVSTVPGEAPPSMVGPVRLFHACKRECTAKALEFAYEVSTTK